MFPVIQSNSHVIQSQTQLAQNKEFRRCRFDFNPDTIAQNKESIPEETVPCPTCNIEIPKS